MNDISPAQRIRDLEAEVAGLRAALSAHRCPQPPVPVTQQCTCLQEKPSHGLWWCPLHQIGGGTLVGGNAVRQCTCTVGGLTTARCPVHQPAAPVIYSQYGPLPGAAGVCLDTVIIPAGNARQFMANVWENTGCAAPPPQIQTFMVST